MSKFIKSSDIIKLVEELPISQLSFGSTETSDQVDDLEVQSIRTTRFTKKGKILPKESEVFNFKFDPISGTTTWSQIIDGQEVGITITFTEIDALALGYVYQPYLSYPGITLTIKRGINSTVGTIDTNSGKFTKYDSGSVITYVYAPSYRSELTKMYQEFSTLSNKARVEGLNGINFPENWDEIPYTV